MIHQSESSFHIQRTMTFGEALSYWCQAPRPLALFSNSFHAHFAAGAVSA